MRRLLLTLAATTALAACQSPTAPAPAPTRTIAPGAPSVELLPPDAVPNASCASGYSVPDGHCL